MNPTRAIQDAFEGLALALEEEGYGPSEELGDPTFGELLTYYGGTSGITSAAGYGTAAEARAAGQTAEREAFMRRLRGYRQFEEEGRRPGSRARDFRYDPESRALIEGMVGRVREASNLQTLAVEIERQGVTVTGEFTAWVSEDEREILWEEPGWWVSGRVARDSGLTAYLGASPVDWTAVQDGFAEATARAYLGGPGWVFGDEIVWLELELGRAPGARAVTT